MPAGGEVIIDVGSRMVAGAFLHELGSHLSPGELAMWQVLISLWSAFSS